MSHTLLAERRRLRTLDFFTGTAISAKARPWIRRKRAGGGTRSIGDLARPRDQPQVRWEVDLADTYLGQALVELSTALDTDRPGAIALRQRVEASRRSILFTALAAEAYINRFLAQMLDKASYRAIDRFPATEKYVLGPRVALGRTLFERGTEPLGSVRRLFKLRDRLVHPKPEAFKVPAGAIWHEPTYEDHNPMLAAQFLAAVSRAAVKLADSADPQTSKEFPSAILAVEARLKRIAGCVTAIPPPTDAEIAEELKRFSESLPTRFLRMDD